jgi:prepilin-type N-terminal cleavage/methylation domain-containing protein
MHLAHSTSAPRARAGFTLVELMAVMVIVGILMAFLLPILLTTEETARIKTTRAKLANIASVCDEYERERGAYPPSRFTAEWGAPPNDVNVGVESLVLALWSRNFEAGGRLVADELANTDGDRSAGAASDLPTSELLEFVDDWGNPVAYIASADYAADQRYFTIDEEGVAGESLVRAVKNATTGRFVAHAKFQLVSAGPDGSFGTEDDIVHPDK